MVNLHEFTYPSSDGVHQVHAAEWRDADCAPRAVVQLVHGISEYILRYDPFARYLAERGMVVVGSDHLGHGRTANSPAEYGFLAERSGWDHLAEDVHALREATGKRFPGLPYFLLGHSMGSFVARTYLIRWPGTVSGCLLSGTGQEPPLLVSAGKTLAGIIYALRGGNSRSGLITGLSTGAYNKKFKPNRTPSDWISADPAVVDAYEADDLCRFTPTVGMFRDMMGGLQFIGNKANLAKMDQDTPVYLYSGDQDPVGGMGEGVRKVYGFFRDAGVKDVDMKLWPGGRHEMHNEVNRVKVYADVLNWIEKHIRA